MNKNVEDRNQPKTKPIIHKNNPIAMNQFNPKSSLTGQKAENKNPKSFLNQTMMQTGTSNKRYNPNHLPQNKPLNQALAKGSNVPNNSSAQISSNFNSLKNSNRDNIIQHKNLEDKSLAHVNNFKNAVLENVAFERSTNSELSKSRKNKHEVKEDSENNFELKNVFNGEDKDLKQADAEPLGNLMGVEISPIQYPARIIPNDKFNGSKKHSELIMATNVNAEQNSLMVIKNYQEDKLKKQAQAENNAMDIVVPEELSNSNNHNNPLKNDNKRKNASFIEISQFPEESKMLEKIAALYSYLDSNKSDLLNINETFFKTNFNKIFIKDSAVAESNSANYNFNTIHEYFNLNQETLIPTSNRSLNKELILREQSFWIIWIEFLTLTFKIREKQNFSERKSLNNSYINNNNNIAESFEEKKEKFFKKFEIVFNIFNASFKHAYECNFLHEYYLDFLKVLPLDNIFLIDKKFRKSSAEIEKGKCFYLNKQANEIINGEYIENKKENEINKNNNYINNNNQALVILEDKSKSNLKRKNENKQMKISSERKTEKRNYTFTNIYRNLMLDQRANAESEILKEEEFSLVKGVDQLASLPDLNEFNVIEKTNKKVIRRRKRANSDFIQQPLELSIIEPNKEERFDVFMVMNFNELENNIIENKLYDDELVNNFSDNDDKTANIKLNKIRRNYFNDRSIEKKTLKVVNNSNNFKENEEEQADNEYVFASEFKNEKIDVHEMIKIKRNNKSNIVNKQIENNNSNNNNSNKQSEKSEKFNLFNSQSNSESNEQAVLNNNQNNFNLNNINQNSHKATQKENKNYINMEFLEEYKRENKDKDSNYESYKEEKYDPEDMLSQLNKIKNSKTKLRPEDVTVFNSNNFDINASAKNSNKKKNKDNNDNNNSSANEPSNYNNIDLNFHNKKIKKNTKSPYYNDEDDDLANSEFENSEEEAARTLEYIEWLEKLHNKKPSEANKNKNNNNNNNNIFKRNSNNFNEEENNSENDDEKADNSTSFTQSTQANAKKNNNNKKSNKNKSRVTQSAINEDAAEADSESEEDSQTANKKKKKNQGFKLDSNFFKQSRPIKFNNKNVVQNNVAETDNTQVNLNKLNPLLYDANQEDENNEEDFELEEQNHEMESDLFENEAQSENNNTNNINNNKKTNNIYSENINKNANENSVANRKSINKNNYSIIEEDPTNGINQEYKFFNKFSIKDYQKELLDWIETKSLGKFGSPKGGIISLPMGAGKTFSTLCKIMFDYNKTKRPSLIVVPKAILSVWTEEIQKFFPKNEGRYVLIYENKQNVLKKFNIEILKTVKVVITTYPFILNMAKKNNYIEKVITKQEERIVSIDCRRIPKKEPNYNRLTGDKLLFEFVYENIVCDESHKFSNIRSTTFLSLMYLIAKKKWCLTGTIIMNKKEDIKSQLMFLGMKVFQIEEITDYMRYIFYRANINTLIKLPDKNIWEETLPFSNEEQAFYNYYRTSYKKAYEKNWEAFEQISCMLVVIMRFRQLCIHPMLLNNNKKENELKAQGTIDFQKIQDEIEISIPSEVKTWLFKSLNKSTSSTKIRRAVDIVKAIPNDEKVIIFSYFKETFVQIEHYMKLNGLNINYVKMTTDKKQVEREIIIDRFRNDPSVKIMFLTFSLGCYGLNLFCANNVIMMDLWWNFAVYDQSIARVYRNGQVRPVNVWVLMIQDSIDIFMKELIELKRDILMSITQNRPVEKDKKQTRLLFEKLLYGEDAEYQ